MHPLLQIVAVTLDAFAACVLVYWGVGLGRVVHTALTIPTARRGVALARRSPSAKSVCVIVPAHNEEHAIGALVASIRAQGHPALRAVLCLDRCTDQTRARALEAIGSDPRVSILEIASCPSGWAGKVNAAWQGAHAEAARSTDLLLFVDADTTLHPSCIGATVALLESRSLDSVSLLSTLSSGTWFERLVQPAAGLELVRQYPIVRSNRRHRRRAFANGQYMLFTREAYDAIGGHEAVKEELLEDLALAQRMADADRPAGVFLADGLLSCRMYESWEAFRRGWKRIYTESTHRKVSRLRKAVVCSALFGSVLPVATAVNLVWSSRLWLDGGEEAGLGKVGACLSAVALAVWFAVLMFTYRTVRAPIWAVPGHPLGAWLVGGILAEAANDLRRGAATTWAGRSYIRTPR